MPEPTPAPDLPDVPVLAAPLDGVAEGWFTGRARRRPTADDRSPGVGSPVRAAGRRQLADRDPSEPGHPGHPAQAPGHPSNLAHRRPHRPADLARARAAVAAHTGTDHAAWHLMHQVHGAEVAVVEPSTPPGTELRGVDAVVTSVPGRVLGVSVADCVPILLAGPTAVGAVHAGRAGVAAGVLGAAIDALEGAGTPPAAVHAAVGPAIDGCCYEVPAAMRDEVAATLPEARATTTWGTPSLDLRAAVVAQLEAAGVRAIAQVGGCTRCDPELWWFSHREDPTTGRQLGLVRRGGPGADDGAGAEVPS